MRYNPGHYGDAQSEAVRYRQGERTAEFAKSKRRRREAAEIGCHSNSGVARSRRAGIAARGGTASAGCADKKRRRMHPLRFIPFAGCAKRILAARSLGEPEHHTEHTRTDHF